jgi:hypothetical protein
MIFTLYLFWFFVLTKTNIFFFFHFFFICEWQNKKKCAKIQVNNFFKYLLLKYIVYYVGKEEISLHQIKTQSKNSQVYEYRKGFTILYIIHLSLYSFQYYFIFQIENILLTFHFIAIPFRPLENTSIFIQNHFDFYLFLPFLLLTSIHIFFFSFHRQIHTILRFSSNFSSIHLI